MEFRSIISEIELPTVGTEHENQYFEFKQAVPVAPYLEPIVVNEWKTQKWDHRHINQKISQQIMLQAQINFEYFEIAKDIAAFANSLGGVILYGAVGSDKSGRKIFLNKYMPVPRDIVERWHAAVNQACIQLCEPSPQIDLRILSCENNWLLVANIQAYPRQSVGIKLKNNSRLVDGFGVSYVFPLRVAEQTTFISPEQLPMFIDPTVRANGIYLSRILREQSDMEKRNVIIHGSAVAHMSGFEREYLLIDVDILSNTYTVKIDSDAQINLPISSISDVWKESLDRYGISIKGRLEVSLYQEPRYIPH